MLARYLYTPTLLRNLLCSIAFVSLVFGGLRAEEGAAFHIECPPDVTVYCTDEIWDLSDYGWAYVYGYGAPQPAPPPYVHYHLNDCGVGYITRTWTAYDYSGYPYSCTQHIYVVSDGDFNGSDIYWPHDYHTYQCNASLDPDHLPYPYDRPRWNDTDCSMVMAAYEDCVFEISPDCRKVLRKWKVIDWCNYQPNNPYHTGGYWEHIQILKVLPYGKPTITCIDDVTVSSNANCSGAYVHLYDVTAISDCGNYVPVSNNSPFATYNGANASGFYPNGTTKVIFTAEDGCGNFETCSIYITVKDLKKPTPICIVGLTANLMVNSDGYYIDLEGRWFDNGSFDNCTPNAYLKFDVEPKHFTCEDLGSNAVKVYVTDAAGNTEYCNTFIDIQDNMGMCPPPDTTTHPVSGAVYSSEGEALEGVLVRISSDDYEEEVYSAKNGSYVFSHILNGEDYVIEPDVDANFRLGLTTFDLLIISKYILGMEDFTSGYDFLAADADMSGSIDIFDLTELRNLLLFNVDELEHGHAWRFVPTGMDIDAMDNPLTEDIHGLIELLELAGQMSGVDFFGVKLGDVNYSASTDGSVSDGRGVGNNLELGIENLALESGERAKIPFTLPEERKVEGFQIGLRYDAKSIDVLGVLDASGSPISPELYKVAEERGEILITWINPGSVSLTADQPLFFLDVKAKQDANVESLLALDLETLNAESYSDQGKEDLLISFFEAKGEITEVLIPQSLKVFPNPTAGDLYLEFPTTELANSIKSIRMISLSSGVSVLEMKSSQQTLQLQKDQMPSSGIYLLEVEVEGQKFIQKVVIQ